MKKPKKPIAFSTFMQNEEYETFDEEENADAEHSTSSIRQIVETGSINVEKNVQSIHCLTIIGQI